MPLETVEEEFDVLYGEEAVDIVHTCHYEWDSSSAIGINAKVCNRLQK